MTHVLIIGLGAYYLAYTVATKDGPYDLFGRFRLWAGARPNQWGRLIVKDGSLASWTICPICQSIYWAVALELFSFWAFGPYVQSVFAAAGIVVILHRFNPKIEVKPQLPDWGQSGILPGSDQAIDTPKNGVDNGRLPGHSPGPSDQTD